MEIETVLYFSHMKSIIAPFKNIQAFSLLIGISFGVFIALLITYFYVYERHAQMRGYSVSRNYLEETCKKKFGTCDSPKMDHSMMGHEMSNPYMMQEVKSEEQFLRDMVLHHEAAVMMAEQVLRLNPSEEVRKLASSIIEAQAKEITQMKSWLIK